MTQGTAGGGCLHLITACHSWPWPPAPPNAPLLAHWQTGCASIGVTPATYCRHCAVACSAGQAKCRDLLEGERGFGANSRASTERLEGTVKAVAGRLLPSSIRLHLCTCGSMHRHTTTSERHALRSDPHLSPLVLPFWSSMRCCGSLWRCPCRIRGPIGPSGSDRWGK